MNRLVVGIIILLTIVPFSASATKTISGIVTDYYGKIPVPGVRVIAVDQSDTSITYETTTTAAGAYLLNVPEALYTLAVNCNGSGMPYISEYYSGVNAASLAELLDMTITDKNNVNFYLLMGYSLTGSVHGDYNPNASGSFYFYDNTTWFSFNGPLSPSLDPSTGAFSINLYQGVYHLLYYGRDDSSMGSALSITVNDTKTGVSIATTNYGRIRGVVYDPTGTGVGYATVTAIDASNGYYMAFEYTELDGSYELTSVPGYVDYYILAGVLPYYGPYTAAFYPDKITPDEASPVFVGPGETVSGVDITLSDQICSVSGVVRDENGSPIAGALVYDFYVSSALNHIQPYSQRLVYSDEAGQYTLVSLAPVAMGIAVVADAYVPEIWQNHSQTTTLASADLLHPSNGEAVGAIDFSLRATSTLGNAPYISQVSPHLLYPGWSGTVTLTGGRFSTSGALIELVDENYLHTEGLQCRVISYSVQNDSTASVLMSVAEYASAQPVYLAVTNPDGQYAIGGLAILSQSQTPEIGLIAAPHRLSGDCTISVAIDLANTAPTSTTVDVYMGLLLPTGDVFYYTGADFIPEFSPLAASVHLPPDVFAATTTMLTIPLTTSLPPGVYSWFIAMFTNDLQLVDFSLKDQPY